MTAILADDTLAPTGFLVVERAFAKGVGNRVRIFEIDAASASTVLDTPISGARR